jgi:hypothetical protein
LFITPLNSIFMHNLASRGLSCPYVAGLYTYTKGNTIAHVLLSHDSL